MIVGLTGGIGSGKSTVANYFSAHGVPIYNSDKEAKRLMTTASEVRRAIVALLGETAYKGPQLNRRFIADAVFQNSGLLLALNAIVHPAVRKDFKAWVAAQTFPYVVQETALIFENQTQASYDRIIVVTAPEAVRIQRVVTRDGASAETIKDRMQHQKSDLEKTALADYVIENISLRETKQRVQQIHQELLDLIT
ncbi:MAG: dephospho-CoA kinase [Bacteroidota bacterium]